MGLDGVGFLQSSISVKIVREKIGFRPQFHRVEREWKPNLSCEGRRL
jgi:hypothetical protein